MPPTIERAQTNGAQQLSSYRPPPRPPRRQRPSDNSGYWAAVALLLGMLVAVLGFVAVWMGFRPTTHATTRRRRRAQQGRCRAWTWPLCRE
jgi:hypothetical protein